MFFIKICIQNQCVTNKSAQISLCISNDDQIVFQSFVPNTIQLPYSPMTCDAFLNFIYINYLYDTGSSCSNSYIKTICCNACLSKLKISIYVNFSTLNRV